MNKKAALHNLGCKVNSYEVEAMQQLLEADGYEIIPFDTGADVYIINTCTVTNIADRKSRQMLHKAKKMNPDAIVVATGCYAQEKGEELKKDQAIDIVIGNDRKHELIEILSSYRKNKELSSFSMDLRHKKGYERLSISRTEEHTRAFIKVQDGCNQFCTYCIIPFARGRVRSRKVEDVVEEAKRLAASGTRELVLTGIHLSSYGLDLDEEDNLLSLIRVVHEVDGIDRIRLGSLEPGIITREFATALAGMHKVCPHFHLSLQSGCDKTLKRMNRRYNSAEFFEKCTILREVFDNPALTTDVITGFPGETEEDFAVSRDFVESIAFFETHIFPYSKREGTKAAAYPDQLTEAVKKARSKELLAIHARRKREYLLAVMGKEQEILIEEKITIGDTCCWIGHTKEYRRAAVPIDCYSDKNMENALVTVVPYEIAEDDILLSRVFK